MRLGQRWLMGMLVASISLASLASAQPRFLPLTKPTGEQVYVAPQAIAYAEAPLRNLYPAQGNFVVGDPQGIRVPNTCLTLTVAQMIICVMETPEEIAGMLAE